jgi:hypothetical protein
MKILTTIILTNKPNMALLKNKPVLLHIHAQYGDLLQ